MSLLNLADGRILEFTVTGPADGMPLVFQHGTPGSGTQLRAMQTATADRGLRLITFCRPGYGASTRQAGRRVADVAADVGALLDHLGVARCLVAGWSGGGPHALATAVTMPERVAGVLVIAGVAPYDAEGLNFLAGMGQQNIEEFAAAAAGEQDLRAFLEPEAAQLRNVDASGLINGLASLLPPVDRAVLTADFGEDMAANFAQALRNGVDGWLDDDLAFISPWGFDLAELMVPAFVWQGDADLMVPFAHGQWLAAQLPGAVAHLLPAEGHLSLSIGKLGAMLDELLTCLPTMTPGGRRQ